MGRPIAGPAFRESDFAGRPPQEQAELSGSLNQLSQQLAATRQLLQDIEVSSPTPDAPAPAPPELGPDFPPGPLKPR